MYLRYKKKYVLSIIIFNQKLQFKKKFVLSIMFNQNLV